MFPACKIQRSENINLISVVYFQSSTYRESPDAVVDVQLLQIEFSVLYFDSIREGHTEITILTSVVDLTWTKPLNILPTQSLRVVRRDRIGARLSELPRRPEGDRIIIKIIMLIVIIKVIIVVIIIIVVVIVVVVMIVTKIITIIRITIITIMIL